MHSLIISHPYFKIIVVAKGLVSVFFIVFLSVNGGWSTWSPWSQCSHPCMIKMRTRECTNPPPENGGLNCTGTKVEQFPCGSAVECQSKDTIYLILQYFFKWVKLNRYFYSFMNWAYTVFFTSIGTLRSNNATATRTSLFQPLSRLFLPTYFEKCRRTLLNINSKGPYPSSEGEIKFRCCLFAFSIKGEIRHFLRVEVAQ